MEALGSKKMPSLKLLSKVSPVSKFWYSIQLNHSLEFACYHFPRTSDWLIPRETRKAVWTMLPWIATKLKEWRRTLVLANAEQEMIITYPNPILCSCSLSTAPKYTSRMIKCQKLRVPTLPPQNMLLFHTQMEQFHTIRRVHLVLNHSLKDVLKPIPLSVHWFFRRSEV